MSFGAQKRHRGRGGGRLLSVTLRPTGRDYRAAARRPMHHPRRALCHGAAALHLPAQDVCPGAASTGPAGAAAPPAPRVGQGSQDTTHGWKDTAVRQSGRGAGGAAGRTGCCSAAGYGKPLHRSSSAGVNERLSCPPQLSGHLPRLAAPAGTAGACPRSSGNAQALSEHRQPPATGAGTAARRGRCCRSPGPQGRRRPLPPLPSLPCIAATLHRSW